MRLTCYREQEAAYQNNIDYKEIIKWMQALHRSVHERDEMVAQIGVDVRGLSNALRGVETKLGRMH